MEVTIKITYEKREVIINEINYGYDNPVYFTYSEMEKLDPDNAYLKDGKVSEDLQRAIDDRIDRDVVQPMINSITNPPPYVEPPREDYINIISSLKTQIADQEEKMTLYGGYDYTEEEKKLMAAEAQAKADELASQVEYTKEELEKMKAEAEKKVSDLTAEISTKPIIEDKP